MTGAGQNNISEDKGNAAAEPQPIAAPTDNTATQAISPQLQQAPTTPTPKTAADLRVAAPPTPWWKRRIVQWLVFIIIFVILAVVFASQLALLSPSTYQKVDWTVTLERWGKLSGIAQSVATVIAIFLGGFWTYFTFIKGRTLKEQLEPKITTKIMMCGSDKFLVAAINLKNTGKTIVNFQQSGKRLVVFRYHASTDSTAVMEKNWRVYYAAPTILRDHLAIEPNEQIEEPVLIPLEKDGQHIYMVRLRIPSKKTTWTVDTIIDGNPPRDIDTFCSLTKLIGESHVSQQERSEADKPK